MNFKRKPGQRKRGAETVTGVAYYERDELEAFLACADDREALEDSYDEWLDNLKASIRDLWAAGLTP